MSICQNLDILSCYQLDISYNKENHFCEDYNIFTATILSDLNGYFEIAIYLMLIQYSYLILIFKY